MLLLRSAMRQPRNGNLNQPIRMHHAYGVDALLNIRLIKAPHTECLVTIIPCYVISNKFPRLLAEREIIANAFLFTDKILPPHKEAASQSYELFQERGGIVRQIFRSYRTHL